MKVMLLEDDLQISDALASILRMQGYAVDTYEDGREAQDRVCDCYDAFIIDINVPNVNGLEILKQIREHNNEAPAVIISAYSDIDTIMKAYDNGCTDYLKKPFDARELKIKMDKLLEAYKPRVKLSPSIEYDRMKKVLFVNSEEMSLTKKEKLLLHILVENRGCIVDHDSIYNYVWGGGKDVKSDSLRSLIRRLRRKMPEDLIKSIVGIGYKIESDD